MLETFISLREPALYSFLYFRAEILSSRAARRGFISESCIPRVRSIRLAATERLGNCDYELLNARRPTNRGTVCTRDLASPLWTSLSAAACMRMRILEMQLLSIAIGRLSIRCCARIMRVRVPTYRQPDYPSTCCICKYVHSTGARAFSSEKRYRRTSCTW